MRYSAPSPFIALTVMATQLLGPAVLWAADQRGIRIEANRQIIVSALSGNQLTADTKGLQFRETVAEGATLTTGPATTAELLVGNRAVVTLGHGTTARVRTVSADQATIQVTNGLVRVAAAASAVGPQGLITVQTPTSQVQTRGGILRVTVDTSINKAEHTPTGAQAYRASYTPEPLVVAATPLPGDIIQVEEGTAEIPGVGPTGGLLIVQAGQRVMVQAGRVGTVAEAMNPGIVTTGILATTGHTLTPKEGRDYLVALQVDQATQLGKALTSPATTSGGDAEKKSDAKNVINGATGGVTLQNTLVSALFGVGSASNPASGGTINRTGSGYGGNNNSDFVFAFGDAMERKGNGGETLLVFTRKDSIEPVVVIGRDILGSTYKAGDSCDSFCLRDHEEASLLQDLGFKPFRSDPSRFTLDKELVLIGGSENTSHGGEAPNETLIVRGLVPIGGAESITNLNLDLHDSRPVSSISDFRPMLPQIVNANSNLVVESESLPADLRSVGIEDDGFVGGTLGQFSLLAELVEQEGIATLGTLSNSTQVGGAITATGSNVLLKGGVILDQETTATIGTTPNTNSYFTDLSTDLGRKFSGSLLSVIRGPQNTPTMLTIQDRMLGVYDGSTINTNGGNKALLSVLDARLKGPGSSIPLIDIAAGTHFDRDGNATPGKQPNVTVTSALVTRSTLPLDGALLEASAPLFALTQANMTTTSHFADLAGNQAQSLKLGDALVALNASKLIINNGHLLNLNNATAAISGYLFSLTNGSTLQVNNGSLFSLNNSSSLTLTSNAFGVFGDGASALTITNNLCSTGPCGDLVNSAGQDILLKGVPIRVSGVTQDVVLPNNFNVFAGNDAANVTIGKDAALFHVDNTSTLTIGQTPVVSR